MNYSWSPEYRTVSSHYHYIFNPNRRGHDVYHGMPFFDEWNPDKGGSFRAGADWIIANLGKRPEGCTLHVVDHEKGFMPDNLEWTSPRKQIHQQMVKIIAQQRHEIRLLKQRINELERC